MTDFEATGGSGFNTPEAVQSPEEILARMQAAYELAGDIRNDSGEQRAIMAVRLYDTDMGAEAVARMTQAYGLAALVHNYNGQQKAILAVKLYDELESLEQRANQR